MDAFSMINELIKVKKINKKVLTSGRNVAIIINVVAWRRSSAG
jgi:hypothetical protein